MGSHSDVKPWVARGPTKGNSGSAYRGSTIHGLALAPLLSFRKGMEYARWDSHCYWTNCMHSNIGSRKWHQLDLRDQRPHMGPGEKKRKAKKRFNQSYTLLPHEPAHGRFLIAQVGTDQSVSRTSTANRIYYTTYLPRRPQMRLGLDSLLVPLSFIARLLPLFLSLSLPARQESPRNCHLIFSRCESMTRTE